MQRANKRRGENLARTVGGAPYNKLQRPDNFTSAQPPRSSAPVEVLRETLWDGREMRNKANDGDLEEEEERTYSRRRGEKIVAQDTPRIDVTTGMHGALALPELESSDVSDDGESYDVMEYIRAVRLVSPLFLVPPQS
jgi:hypothetical protein